MSGMLQHADAATDADARAVKAGLKFGARSVHTSRTIMLAELGELFAAVPPEAAPADYAAAVVDENALGKATAATRRLTHQRLRELYALDPRVPMFRILRRLWPVDAPGRPRLALLCALARDPLLRATAPVVLALPSGAELVRASLLDAIGHEVGPRLNDAVLDKAARNSASSWAQAGHLAGRVRKLRRRVEPTPATAALALWLGDVDGFAGRALLDTRWTQVLDRRGAALWPAAAHARKLGLIRARAAGGVVEIDVRRLDPARAG